MRDLTQRYAQSIEKLRSRLPWIVLAMSGAIALPIQVGIWKFLWRDGSNQVLDLLRDREFPHWETTRQFTHYLIYAPGVFAVKVLHWESLPDIIRIYGASLVYVPFAFIALAVALARGLEPELIVLPALSYVCSSIVCSLFAVTETHLAAAVFWVLFISLLRLCRTSSVPIAVLASLFAVLLTRIHEGSAVYFPVLLVSALFAGRHQALSRKWPQLTLVIFSGLATTAGFIRNSYYVLWPAHDYLKAVSAPRELFYLVSDPTFSLPCLLTLGLLLANHLAAKLSQKYSVPKLGLYYGIALAGILGISAGLASLASDRFFSPQSQYYGRYVGLLLPTLLAGFSLYLKFLKSRKISEHGLAQLLIAFTFLWGFSISSEGICDVRWVQFRSSLMNAIHDHAGVLNYRESAIGASPFANWCLPSLSLELSAIDSPIVRTVVTTPDLPGWQPFDVGKKDLPDLRLYHVHYRIPGVLED